MTDLDKALAFRDSVLDQTLLLREYTPRSEWRDSLNRFICFNEPSEFTPQRLKNAQRRVLELLEVETDGTI